MPAVLAASPTSHSNRRFVDLSRPAYRATLALDPPSPTDSPIRVRSHPARSRELQGGILRSAPKSRF